MMTQERFEALAEAYGGDLAQWPEAERSMALAYASAHDDKAAPVLKTAQALDALLNTAAEPAPSAVLFDQVVARGVAERRRSTPVWAAAAAALMLTIGLGAGWVTAPGGVSQSDDVFASAFGTLEEVELFTLEEEA